MKNFKKIAFIAVLTIIGSFSFADYAGDLQLRALGFGGITMDINKISGKSVPDGTDNSYSTSTYNFGMTTYHTWMIGELPLGIGFMTGWDFGADLEESGITFIDAIGPAISFTAGRVLRLESSFTFDMGFLFDSATKSNTETSYFLFGVGIGCDVTAVFVPNATFSPIVGFNYTKMIGDGITDAKTSSSSVSKSFNGTFDTLKFYIGGCFNFGREP